MRMSGCIACFITRRTSVGRCTSRLGMAATGRGWTPSTCGAYTLLPCTWQHTINNNTWLCLGDRKPKWSAFREPSFGHGMFVVHNASIATWEWHRNVDGKKQVADSVVLERLDNCLAADGASVA